MNVRDGMSAYGVSLLLHCVIVGVVLFSWAGTPELRRPKPAPPHIQAVVMERPTPAAPAAQPRPTPPPQAQRPAPTPPPPRPTPPPRPAEVPKPTPAPRPEPRPQLQPEPKPAPAPAYEQPDLTELLAQEEVERAEQRQAASEAPQPAQSDSDSLESDPETAEYVAAIQSTVGRRWTRPPSARNGMEVKLNVRLAPGGDVLNVTLQQSSGDAALDRTALAAVKNAGRLPVPEGAAFEKFREFTFLFRPEDMRL